MTKSETIPGRSKRTPSAPQDPRASGDPKFKKKKKKKLNTITVGGDSGVKIMEIGHKNPEGLRDAKNIKGKPHSSPEGRFLSKLRTQPLVVKYNKGGRAGFQHGGRTNLLEELGRVEGEHSNKNRRAEVSRIHGELNKGYKGGKRVGLKGGGSAGPVLENKKVGCQIK